MKFHCYVLVILYSQVKKYIKKFSGGIQTRKDLCTSVPLASCSGEIKKIVLIGLQCSWVLSSLNTSTPSCFGQIQIMQSFQLSSSPTAQKSDGLIYIWHCRVANSAQKDRYENATKKGLIQLRIVCGAAIEMESSFNLVERIVHKHPENSLIFELVLRLKPNPKWKVIFIKSINQFFTITWQTYASEKKYYKCYTE